MTGEAPSGRTLREITPALSDEALRAFALAHEWLERVEEHREYAPGMRTYIGLDHRIGQNVDGCTLCHAVAAFHGLVEPIAAEDE